MFPMDTSSASSNCDDRAKIAKEMGNIKEYKEDEYSTVILLKTTGMLVFRNTFLEDGGAKGYIKTGIVQFGWAFPCPLSSSGIPTLTRQAFRKARTKAPLPTVVEHGVYVMPFSSIPLAHKSGCASPAMWSCSNPDPMYEHLPAIARMSASVMRVDRAQRCFWEASQITLSTRLRPNVRGQTFAPSAAWSDYDVPSRLPTRQQSECLRSDA